jgi:hypothetical protein
VRQCPRCPGNPVPDTWSRMLGLLFSSFRIEYCDTPNRKRLIFRHSGHSPTTSSRRTLCLNRLVVTKFLLRGPDAEPRLRHETCRGCIVGNKSKCRKTLRPLPTLHRGCGLWPGGLPGDSEIGPTVCDLTNRGLHSRHRTYLNHRNLVRTGGPYCRDWPRDSRNGC